MEEILSFESFEAQLREMLAEGDYLRIINRIEDEGDRYPDQRIYLAYWQIGMAARDGNPDLAFAYLDELIEEGIWISQFLLRNSPSLEMLQDHLEYEDRIEAMAALQRSEASQLLPLLTLRQEARARTPGQPYPLMIGLHADRATAIESIRYWQPAAEEGWLVGVPQSTQALWSGAYVWEDSAHAQQELQGHIRDLREKYPLDLGRLILAGHRQGGELAAWLPCSRGIDARGFIALEPAGPQITNPDRWFRMLQAGEPTGLRGVLVAAENDPHAPEFKRLADILNAFDVPTHLDLLPAGTGDLRTGFQEALLRGIDFVLS